MKVKFSTLIIGGLILLGSCLANRSSLCEFDCGYSWLNYRLSWLTKHNSKLQ